MTAGELAHWFVVIWAVVSLPGLYLALKLFYLRKMDHAALPDGAPLRDYLTSKKNIRSAIIRTLWLFTGLALGGALSFAPHPPEPISRISAFACGWLCFVLIITAVFNWLDLRDRDLIVEGANDRTTSA